LECGAESAAMSGSGATVFGIFRERNAASRAAEKLGGVATVFVAI
jgi:4-diphosphocytidyl-2C-methyl-D-erythritol kinase